MLAIGILLLLLNDLINELFKKLNNIKINIELE